MNPTGVGENDRPARTRLGAVPTPVEDDPDTLLLRTAHGDERAFERLYDAVAPRVFGLIRRIVRNPAQAEEVAQEVLVEVWRTATRFDPDRGTATSWIFTIAHRRAVDRVRSEQAGTDRMKRVATSDVPYDDVVEAVAAHLEQLQVRRCLAGLTEMQREAITMAYYGGYTYREVASLLKVGLPAIKTRMRDGLIRLRDCLGVTV